MGQNNPYATYKKMAMTMEPTTTKEKKEQPIAAEERAQESKTDEAAVSLPANSEEAIPQAAAPPVAAVPAAEPSVATIYSPTSAQLRQIREGTQEEARLKPLSGVEWAYHTKPEKETGEEPPPNPYLENKVMTAGPQELTLLLYEGALRFMSQAVQMIHDKDMSQAHNANIRAQDIIIELMATLNKDMDISNNLFNLYAFILDSLQKANFSKEPEQIQQAIELVKELRDTWEEAMQSVQAEAVAAPAATAEQAAE